MEKAIKELLGNIEIEDSFIPHFQKKGYTPIKLSKNNFVNIEKVKSEKSICFIDGGNQEIIGTHSFSLQLLRIYYTIYKNNKRILAKINEAYALISTKKVNGKLCFNAKIFPKKEDIALDDFNFDLYDKTLSTASFAVNISSIGDLLRKFFEIKTAEYLSEKKMCDIIVLDTTLEENATGEKEAFEKLYEKAEKNDVSIFAFAKTSSILTEDGKSALGILNNMGPDNSWYYYPIVKIDNDCHKAEMYIIKLHPKSKYVFRFERYKKSNIDMNEVFSILVDNSKDPVFIGYPYGLIEADRFARVQNREIEILKTRLITSLGKDFEKIRAHLNTKNAHDILDSIG